MAEVEKGFRRASRGAGVGLLLALIGLGLTWASYAVYLALLALPIAPILFAVLFVVFGAVADTFRAGRYARGMITLGIIGAVVALPFAVVGLRGWLWAERVALIESVRAEDGDLFLTRLRSPVSRWVVRQYLEQHFVCAGLASRPEVIDALVAIDPRGTEGYALCGIAHYGTANAIRSLLSKGFRPSAAHDSDGGPCDPLEAVAEGTRATSGCSLSMMGEFDQFSARPTAEGCRRKLEVARALVEAGARTRAPSAFPEKEDACPELTEVLRKAGSP